MSQNPGFKSCIGIWWYVAKRLGLGKIKQMQGNVKDILLPLWFCTYFLTTLWNTPWQNQLVVYAGKMIKCCGNHLIFGKPTTDVRLFWDYLPPLNRVQSCRCCFFSGVPDVHHITSFYFLRASILLKNKDNWIVAHTRFSGGRWSQKSRTSVVDFPTIEIYYL